MAPAEQVRARTAAPGAPARFRRVHLTARDSSRWLSRHTQVPSPAQGAGLLVSTAQSKGPQDSAGQQVWVCLTPRRIHRLESHEQNAAESRAGTGGFRGADPWRLGSFRPPLRATTALPGRSQLRLTQVLLHRAHSSLLQLQLRAGAASPLPPSTHLAASSFLSVPLILPFNGAAPRSELERNGLMAIKFPFRILDSDPSILLCREYLQ